MGLLSEQEIADLADLDDMVAHVLDLDDMIVRVVVRRDRVDVWTVHDVTRAFAAGDLCTPGGWA